MSKSAKVSVFEIRGEIHYAEDDVENPINPIKYFCVSFLWPVFLPSACHYYFSLCGCRFWRKIRSIFSPNLGFALLSTPSVICVNGCHLTIKLLCCLQMSRRNTLKSIQPETFRTWTQSRLDGKRMQNTRIRWFSCFNKAFLLVQGATVKTAVSSTSKYKYGIIIKPVSLVSCLFSTFPFFFCLFPSA